MVGRLVQVGVVAAALAAVVHAERVAAFVAFESGPVRPLAITPDGSRLLAVNTPDARLEVFALQDGAPVPVASVAVGLEPVAVAARTADEVWVVNHLSDSVSVVDLAADPPRVVRTLLVGDEPRDIVFAGPRDGQGHFTRAFITTARRGQNLPATVPPALTTAGVPRALVYVFAAADLGTSLGGTPETIVELFGDTPRALAVTPDGGTVYAAVFQSGNQTTTVTEGAVCDGGAAAPPCAIDGVQVPGGLADGFAPGGLPAPNASVAGVPAPEAGLIVRWDPLAGIWADELGRNWNNGVRFALPDHDVFRIDARTDPPTQTGSVAGVGTVLFNMLVDPASGYLLVSNTEARNEVRFEGPGSQASTVRGHLHESRISIVDGVDVVARHLNKHIAALADGYRTEPMPPAVKAASLATPMDMALANDGTLYVAAFGSSVVGVFDAAELEDDSFVPGARQIALSGGGPAGLALDEAAQRLYVLTRFDNAIAIVDTATDTQIGRLPLHDPEPQSLLAGRRFLYDARLTSSNGEASCATCHLFADLDSLAWDLGNPDDEVLDNFNPLGPTGTRVPFHPMKGPMTTQTLRGMAHQGPMHWRGDRTGATSIVDQLAYDARLAFEKFNVAFEGLLGRDEGELSAADMAAFTEFILQVQPPPNPIRALDNSLTPAQAAGRTLFLDRDAITDSSAHCAGCHTLKASEGHFGTLGQSTFDDEPQHFKVPQLKNMYQKVGMFGTPHVHFAEVPPEAAAFQGDQVRGFGFVHDGSIATVFDFLRGNIFRLTDEQRRDLEQFVLAFDSTYAPIVGQQITLTADNAAATGPRLDLLLARARTPFDLVDAPNATECDLVAHAVIDGEARGFVLAASGAFRSDRAAEAERSVGELRGVAIDSGTPVTFTCVPPGEGVRLGLDRDGDSLLDRDELDRGSDPADPNDPTFGTPTPTDTAAPTQRPTRTPTPRADHPGDANCDDTVDLTDVRATCTALFDRRLARHCGTDCNGDGQATAADLSCALELCVQ
jgi:DNA-binding beta-propeller fold protein YncE/mono/diheme cytochrome c family protein